MALNSIYDVGLGATFKRLNALKFPNAESRIRKSVSHIIFHQSTSTTRYSTILNSPLHNHCFPRPSITIKFDGQTLTYLWNVVTFIWTAYEMAYIIWVIDERLVLTSTDNHAVAVINLWFRFWDVNIVSRMCENGSEMVFYLMFCMNSENLII